MVSLNLTKFIDIFLEAHTAFNQINILVYSATGEHISSTQRLNAWFCETWPNSTSSTNKTNKPVVVQITFYLFLS